MELTLAGTGTCSPVKGRAPACYHLSMGPHRIIIDPGPGAVNRLTNLDLDPLGVDAIFLSHHHLDHCADLLPWLFSYKYGIVMEERAASARSGGSCGEKWPKPSRRDPMIVAPEGFKRIFGGLMEVYGGMIISPDYQIRIEEVLRTEWDWPGGAAFRSVPMAHFIPAVGYLFREPGGPALAYSGDTGPCAELVELASLADALLVECALPEHLEVDGHMTPSSVARVAIQSGVKKLILTHFYPPMDPKAAVEAIRAAGYQGEIIAGEDGMMVRI
jgi:ribonuclease BN (tRNA processing enzyme)